LANDIPDWAALTTPRLIDGPVAVAALGNATHNGVVVPTGTHSLLAVAALAAGGGAGQIQIVGGVSGLQYLGSDLGRGFPSNFQQDGLIYYQALSIDATVNVIYFAAAGAGTTFWLIALPDPSAVTLLNQPNVILSTPNSFGPIFTNQELGGNFLLGVTESRALPAPWQAAAADWTVGSGGIAGGATLVLVAGVVAQTVWLHEAQLHLGAGAAGSFGQLQDTTGVGLRQMNFAIADIYPFEFHGRALVSGRGLQIKNTSGAASGSINGGGGFSQQ
jgi:hypothetical protein